MFSRAEWLRQAAAHIRAARLMYTSGHPKAGDRQIALAREARVRARTLFLVAALIRWGEAVKARAGSKQRVQGNEKS